jgi:MFS family permease
MSMEKMDISKNEPLSTTNRRWSKTWPQHLVAALAAFALVCAGTVDRWTAPAIPYLQEPHNLTDVTVPVVTYVQGSWIGSPSPLGSLVGSVPAGYLADLMGRRLLILIMTVPMLVSWVTIMYGYNSIMLLYIARFILGFTWGTVAVAVVIFSDEISEFGVRGTVGRYSDLIFTVGMLYVYIAGAILWYVEIKITYTILPFLFAVTFCWIPESPLYLLTKGKTEKAKKSLFWFRGVGTGQSAEIEGELNEMESFINRPSDITSVSSDQIFPRFRAINFFKILSVTSKLLKAIISIFALMTFPQLCGVNAVLAYTVAMFESAGLTWDPYSNTALFGVVQFVFTVIAIFTVDRIGIRILIIISGAGMLLSLLLLVTDIHLFNQGVELEHITWLPVIGVNLYIATFSVGLGTVPWFMMAFLLSNEARGWVSSIAVSLHLATAFLVRSFFLVIISNMSLEATYGKFLFICLVSTIFVLLYIPETKMRTRER